VYRRGDTSVLSPELIHLSILNTYSEYETFDKDRTCNQEMTYYKEKTCGQKLIYNGEVRTNLQHEQDLSA
jgi:hypothetical protein